MEGLPATAQTTRSSLIIGTGLHFVSNWIQIASVDECPAGSCIERVAAGRVVALFCVDGDYFALEGVCPHQGGPLGRGVLSGCTVTCPWHGWQFDVRDGQHRISPSIRQPRIQVKTANGTIYVQLDEVSSSS